MRECLLCVCVWESSSMQEYVTSCVCVCVCVCVCMQGSYSALLHQLGQLATSCYNRLAGFTFTIVVTVAAVVSATVLVHTSLTLYLYTAV